MLQNSVQEDFISLENYKKKGCDPLLVYVQTVCLVYERIESI